MASNRTVLIASLTAAAIAGAGLATPSMAGESRTGFDARKLDKASAEYSYYRGYGYRGHRGGWNGARGAAVAGVVGLGILGAAAAAANSRAYADPYYGYDGYAYEAPQSPVYYEPAPVYEAPVYAPRYRYYPGAYDSRYRSRNGTTDPARGGR